MTKPSAHTDSADQHEDRHSSEHTDEAISPALLRALGEVSEKEEAEHARQHEDQVLEVSEIISTAASFYEKVRYMVDYREDHTIRRNATERILKRKLLLEGKVPSGADLLQELVEGKYLPQEEATESAVRGTTAAIADYAKLIREARLSQTEARPLISFAASEIDAFLSPLAYAVDTSVARAMYETIRPKFDAPRVRPEVIDVQLLCAVWRALLRADNESLAYALWRLSPLKWRGEGEGTTLSPEEIKRAIRSISAAVKNDLQWEFVPKIKNEAIYFHVVKALFLEEKSSSEHTLQYPDKIADFTREFLEKKFEQENQRIKRSGIRAVIYLLCTKLFLVAALEWPYEAFILKHVNYVPLAINAFFHPLLLLALTRKVGFPGEDNTEAVIAGVQNAVRGKVRPIVIRSSSSRNLFVFGLVYLVMTIGLFGAILGVLQAFEFNILGGTLFLFFLALVMYFAFRIRYRASQWRVTKDERPLAVLGSVLTTPIIHAGRWLSRTFSSVNILVLVMDFIIETPFKYLLDFSHQFLRYLREKADDLY
jgi:hypothetical protein